MTIDLLGGIAGIRVLIAALFVGTLCALEAGRWLGRRRFDRDPDRDRAGLGAVEGSVFGLLGLLVAFTFSGAAARLDQRRALSVEEANDIGTAYLRVDLLPAAAQPEIRDLFRRYTDTRLAFFAALDDRETAEQALAATTPLQDRLWDATVAACRTADDRSVTMLLLPALNAMFDVTTARTMALLHHPPTVVYVMLLVLTLVSAMLAGYGMGATATRNWLHVIGFALITSLAIYVILELEFPRLGLVTIDAIDQVMRDVRASMGP